MVTMLVQGAANLNERVEIIKENFIREGYGLSPCNQKLDYPLKRLQAAAGSLWKNGKLTICGGATQNPGKPVTFKYRSECFSLENGEWSSGKNLLTSRYGHGSSNVGNSIWMTGGFPSFPYVKALASTEIINTDGNITPGPDLPQGRGSHCQLSYGQSTFIIGKFSLCQKTLNRIPVSKGVSEKNRTDLQSKKYQS